MDVAIDVRPGKKAGYPAGPRLATRLLKRTAWGQNGADFIVDAAREFGDLVYYRVMGRDFYLVNHPDLIQDFFTRDAVHHDRNVVMQRGRDVLGHGLLTSEEPLHMRQRRLMQPAFLRERIAGFGAVIGQKTMEMSARWQPGVEMDLHGPMMELALRIVGKCLFDLDELEQVDEMADAVDSFMVFVPLAFLPFSRTIEGLPLPAMNRLRRGKKLLDDLIYAMIAERRADGTDRGDLLSMLLSATDDGAKMDDRQLRDECVTIILAGHETTANALSFALGLLGRHSDVQERLAAEARAVLGDRAPVAEDYARLPYATAVFAETMRLYPPVWITGRTCREAYEIAGYRIPVGATVFAPQIAVHRDPRYWDRPEEFDPERFSTEGKAGRVRYCYFPFAGGSRQCIAEGLAWMEGTLALAAIAREWQITPVPGEIRVNPAITLRPKGGVKVVLERR